MVRFTHIWVLAGVLLLGAPKKAHSQNADSTFVYSFVFVGVPLETALNSLIDKTRINLFFESSLVKGKRSNCTIHQSPLPSVLKCVLSSSGLDYYVLSNGTYVLQKGARSPPQHGRMTGFVVDAETGLPLENAAVLLPDHDIGTATNRAGWFVLPNLRAGEYSVVVTHVAYRGDVKSITIQPIQSAEVRIPLTSKVVQADAIVINGFSSRQPSSLLGMESREIEQLADIPGSGFAIGTSVGGIPGISSGEALGDVHVQGSDSGSHEYLLDEAPVYMPIKNGNFIGPFSPLAIQHIAIHRAGFPARTGSQLAGVVEINQLFPSHESSSTTIQADLLAFNFRNQQSLDLGNNRRFGWVISGRKAMWRRFHPDKLTGLYKEWSRPDLYLADQLGLSEGMDLSSSPPVEVDFFDLHGAFKYELGKTRILSGSYYAGRNVFGSSYFEDIGQPGTSFTDEYTWDNRVLQLRYEWVQSSRVFMHVGLWQSDYRLDHPFSTLPLTSPGNGSNTQEFNEIDQLGGRIRADFSMGDRSLFRTGLIARISDSDFTISTRPLLDAPDLTPTTTTPSRWLITAFVDDQFSFSERSTLEIGSRFSLIPSHGRIYMEPRISWRKDFSFSTGQLAAYRISAGIYRQFTSQFDLAPFTASALLPSFRFWIPTGKKDKPPYSFHFASNSSIQLSSAWSVDTEYFFKYSPRTLVLNYSQSSANPIADARTKSMGVSFSSKFSASLLSLTGWYATEYSLQQQTGRFSDRWISTPWETPHRFGLSTDLNVMSHFNFHTSLSVTVGRKWGYRLSYYNYLPLISGDEQTTDLTFTNPESDHLPSIFRVDVGVSYRRSFLTYIVTTRLSALNILDRKNVIDRMIPQSFSPSEPGSISRTGMPQLFMFSLQFSLK